MVRLVALPMFVLLLLVPAVPFRQIAGGAPVSPSALAIDAETIIGRGHFVDDLPADHPDGSVNAVIEIPSGTTGKFEVDEGDGVMHWRHDRYTGERREVDYLPFPVNYGMVPRTLGDDGDPLDIIVLGRGFERAHVVRTAVIGVLAMGDEAGRDDKLVTVPLDPELRNGFSRLVDIDELDASYPGLRAILVVYFSNYWGADATTVLGWGDAAEARDILAAAKLRYRDSRALAARTARPAAADLHPRAPSPSGVPVH